MNDVVVIVARLMVGAAFVVAGSSKIAMGAHWLRQAAELGAPPVVSRPLPWVEIVLGAALVVGLVLRWSAGAAILLLVGFSALVAHNLRLGRRPPCACFGAWSSAPIGPSTLVRNGVLAALAVVVVVLGG